MRQVKGGTMDIRKILLPYNFTDLDKKALEFVIRTFGLVQAVEVTLFNVYYAAPTISTQDSPIMKKVQENIAYLNRMVAEQEAALDQTRETLLSRGFTESHVRTIFEPRTQDIADHIIEKAISENADVVVINRKPGKISRFFTGSVFSKVITGLKDTTVCIVT
jgi:nucleotide-binding universal stress UspA family protein